MKQQMDSWLPVASALGLSAQTGLGTGEPACRPLEVEDRTRLIVRGSLSVTVHAGLPLRAECLGDANLLDLVKARVSQDVLILELDDEVEARHPPRVELWIPHVRMVEVRDSARLDVHCVEGDLAAVAREAGQLSLQGRAATLVLTGAEAARLESARCPAQNVVVHLSGVARARLRGLRSICADCSGASQLDCVGRPEQREIHCSGLALVNFHREWGAPAHPWARFLPPR
jgi:hypothetical protein